MSWSYIVSAQKPTAVTSAISGNFTAPTDLNLVLAKVNRLELYLVGVEGLRAMQEVNINGRIALIQLFRPPGEPKDLLFVLTSKYHAAILEYQADLDGGAGQLVTRAYGNVSDRTGRPAETGFIAVIDPTNKVIGLRLYDGLFKVVVFQSDSRELKAFNLRFEDLHIVDIHFLHSAGRPTIAYIHQDQNGRHVKTQEISLADKEFVTGPWKQENVEAEATILLPIPLPYGGCVVIGAESISYHKEEANYKAVAPPILKQSTIVCTCRIDDTRFLMGDMGGRLFMLILDARHTMDGVAVVDDLKSGNGYVHAL